MSPPAREDVIDYEVLYNLLKLGSNFACTIFQK